MAENKVPAHTNRPRLLSDISENPFSDSAIPEEYNVRRSSAVPIPQDPSRPLIGQGGFYGGKSHSRHSAELVNRLVTVPAPNLGIIGQPLQQLPSSNLPGQVDRLQMSYNDLPAQLDRLQMSSNNYPGQVDWYRHQMSSSNYPSQVDRLQVSSSNFPCQGDCLQMPPNNLAGQGDHFQMPPNNLPGQGHRLQMSSSNFPGQAGPPQPVSALHPQQAQRYNENCRLALNLLPTLTTSLAEEQPILSGQTQAAPFQRSVSQASLTSGRNAPRQRTPTPASGRFKGKGKLVPGTSPSPCTSNNGTRTGTPHPYGKPSVKHLTCFWWKVKGICRFAEDDCLYAHRETGLLADAPRQVKPGGKHLRLALFSSY